MHSLVLYLTVAGIAAVVTMAANRPARMIAVHVGYTAQPDPRKVHTAVTPYGGGAAMFIGLCTALTAAVAVPTGCGSDSRAGMYQTRQPAMNQSC